MKRKFRSNHVIACTEPQAHVRGGRSPTKQSPTNSGLLHSPKNGSFATTYFKHKFWRTLMKQRSIFFPLALIAAGVVWLLVSMGRIPSENVWALAHFWPFLLIAAGLGLMLRSFWEPARLILDVLVVGAAVAAIVFAPQLGWNTPSWGLGFGFDGNFGGGARGSGKVVTETREVQDFLAISVSYPADVLIQQGKSESVKIEAEDNLLPQLSSEMQNGTLIIR